MKISQIGAHSAVLLLVVALAVISSSQPAPREQVGVLPDGGFLLNSGWRVKAAGTQVQLDTLPMSSALSPNGRFLVVLNGGYRPPSLSVTRRLVPAKASSTETSR